MPAETVVVSPPQYARRLGVNVEIIHEWIRSGELAAIDISQNSGTGRPRWRITPDAIADFERRRASTPLPVKPPRKRTTRDASVTKYF